MLKYLMFLVEQKKLKMLLNYSTKHCTILKTPFMLRTDCLAHLDMDVSFTNQNIARRLK